MDGNPRDWPPQFDDRAETPVGRDPTARRVLVVCIVIIAAVQAATVVGGVIALIR